MRVGTGSHTYYASISSTHFVIVLIEVCPPRVNAEIKVMFDEDEPGITDLTVTRFLAMGNSGFQDFCPWNKALRQDERSCKFCFRHCALERRNTGTTWSENTGACQL